MIQKLIEKEAAKLVSQASLFSCMLYVFFILLLRINTLFLTPSCLHLISTYLLTVTQDSRFKINGHNVTPHAVRLREGFEK